MDIKEGMISKGGTNEPPTTARPPPPAGQGGTTLCNNCSAGLKADYKGPGSAFTLCESCSELLPKPQRDYGAYRSQISLEPAVKDIAAAIRELTEAVNDLHPGNRRRGFGPM